MRLKLVMRYLACFTFFIGSSQTDDGQETNTTVRNVKNDIYILEGKGGNVAFSTGEDGVFMIDDQFAEGAKGLLKDIRRVSDEPIKFLVNTHAHGDHTGANAFMAAEGAIIVSHIGVRDTFFEKIKSSESSESGERGEKIDMTAFPMVTFEDKMNFHMNGDNILVFHVDNAHTDGDAVVFFTDSNVLHAGDLFFNGKYPYIDTDGGGSVKGYIEGIDKILMLCDNETKIIPGHGKLGNMAGLKASRNMLHDLYRNVTFNYLKGKTEPEILAMRDFTGPYDSKGYGNGFISTEKILKVIYDQVSREQADFDPRSLEVRLKELERENGRTPQGREAAIKRRAAEQEAARKEAEADQEEKLREKAKEKGGGQ